MNSQKLINIIKRLLYTQRNYFIKLIRKIKSIDLIEYLINLTYNTKSIYISIKIYILKKKKFIVKIFFNIKKVEIIIRIASN